MQYGTPTGISLLLGWDPFSVSCPLLLVSLFGYLLESVSYICEQILQSGAACATIYKDYLQSVSRAVSQQLCDLQFDSVVLTAEA